jgi:hypothetical protein
MGTVLQVSIMRHRSPSLCHGPVSRRELLRFGLVGFGGLSLADVNRLRAEEPNTSARRRTALIIVWLHGGASHIETYDPKPQSPSEYRGPYRPIDTAVPGMQFCELLPRQAAIADKLTVLKSLTHTGFCHDDGPQQIFTGHPVQGRRLKPDDPDLLCIANYLRSDPRRTVPNYVGVNPIPYLGSAYLGPAYDAFAVHGDPNSPKFTVPNIGLPAEDAAARLGNRRNLRVSLDRLPYEIDLSKNMRAMDEFESQAWNLLTGTAAQQAFHIDAEDDRTRDFYGRNQWGQQCLLARRLVEAGVELVSVTFNGPLCGRVGNWDDHAVNHHVFDGLKYRTAFMDQAIAALITDIHQRGLNDDVMVIIGGDFGRTPKISYAASTGEGIASAPVGVMQPGRDHWPNAMSFVFSGGKITPGQIIGSTDVRGENAVERRVGVQDFLATIYTHLGIDAQQVEIQDFSGRPIPILQSGKAIPELTASA